MNRRHYNDASVNATLSVDYPATLAKNFLYPSLQAPFQAVPQADVSLARLVCKATEDGTVDVENTNNLIFTTSGRTISELLVASQAICRQTHEHPRYAALDCGQPQCRHAAPDGYPDTGNFALKWSEHSVSSSSK